MLGNKKKDFVEELLVTFLLMGLFIIIIIGLEYVYSYYAYSLLQDAIILFILSFFVFFPMIYLIRYAFVFRAYPVLYSPYIFFSSLLIFIGADAAKNIFSGSSRAISSAMIVLAIAIATLLYTLWIYKLKKRGLFKKTVPPERIAVLRAMLTPKEKLTLIFPDRYIKYLETGDEKYLKEANKG